jgi:hypothetical protein
MFPCAGSPQPGARSGERWERGGGGHRSRVCFFVLPTSFMSCDRFTCTLSLTHSLTHARTHTHTPRHRYGRQVHREGEKHLFLHPDGDYSFFAKNEKSLQTRGGGLVPNGWDLYTVSPTVGGRGPTQSVPFWSMWMAAFSPHTRTYSGRDLRRRPPSTLTTAPRSAGRPAAMSVSEDKPEYLRGRAEEQIFNLDPPGVFNL